MEFWQAPGRRKIFNTTLNDWKNNSVDDSSIVSMALLKFIKDNPDISVEDYEIYFDNFLSEFKQELDLNRNIPLNASENKSDRHLFRTLLFIGFIKVSSSNISDKIKKSDKLNITESGENFLSHIQNENFSDALYVLIMNLIETKYKNKATVDVKFDLYPFLIIFKLFFFKHSNGFIPRMMFKTDIPFIINEDDFYSCLDKLNDDCYIFSLKYIKSNSLLHCGYANSHFKWDQWIISSLLDLGILEEEDDNIILSNTKKEFIQNEIEKKSINELFQN